MPYVKQTIRDELKDRKPENAGELNYVICRDTVPILMKDWGAYQELEDMVKNHVLEYLETKDLSYQTCCEITGVLTHIQHELDRRYPDIHTEMLEIFEEVNDELYKNTLDSYEDKKIEENGDVFTELLEWSESRRRGYFGFEYPEDDLADRDESTSGEAS